MKIVETKQSILVDQPLVKQIVKLLLHNEANEWLVGIRAPGDTRGCQLDFIGGGVDDDDKSLEEAALRELMEETGLDADQDNLHKVAENESIGQSTGNRNVVTYFAGYFYGNVDEANPNTGEMVDVFMMPGIEIIETIEHPYQAEVFTRHYVSGFDRDLLDV